MTNRTSPASVRLTPAAYLLALFFGLVAADFVLYVQDQPIAYLISLFFTVVAFLGFADQASKYGRF